MDFHANEVKWYPAAYDDEKRCSFVVSITPKTAVHTFLWRVAGTVILPINDCALIGVNEAMYSHELRRLYHHGLSTNQAILLGIHLFSIAKATSNYIGGNTDIIAVLKNRMFRFDADEVRELEQHVAACNERMAALVLAAPDYAMGKVDFDKLLRDLKRQMIRLRARYPEEEDQYRGLHAIQCIDWEAED